MKTGNSTQQIKEQISEHGMKCTSQRIAIYRALLQSSHPSAEEIYRLISDEYPSISLSTVYNTLETFAEKKLIGKLITNEGKKRYCPNAQPHAHLFDEESGVLTDYYDSTLQEYVSHYFARKPISGFEIKSTQIIIYGKRSGK